jgi:hypothetical protein
MQNHLRNLIFTRNSLIFWPAVKANFSPNFKFKIYRTKSIIS